jgi:phosphoribosylformylglycinamidine (FGAM) synthase-like amidotransferase family enzyme
VLPGGFAYEDRSRAGIVAAKDPIMNIIKEQAALGKPVIGICNGCQVLVESGLVPGVTNDALAGAVAMNTRVKDGKIIGTGFYHDKVNIKSTAPQGRTAVTMDIGVGDIIPASVANGEGRFIFPTDLLLELERHNQIIFKYCNDDGSIVNEFPTTPNGAMWGIAGLCNKAGNVVAYMPHPERFDTGIPLFASLKTYLEKKPTPESYELQWQPPQANVEPYEPEGNVLQLLVDLIITDNEANNFELKITTVFNKYIEEKLDKINSNKINNLDNSTANANNLDYLNDFYSVLYDVTSSNIFNIMLMKVILNEKQNTFIFLEKKFNEKNSKMSGLTLIKTLYDKHIAVKNEIIKYTEKLLNELEEYFQIIYNC